LARERGLRLVSAGRLDWIKGLDIVILALAQLPKQATLTLIGDGPCRGFLGRFSEALGISDRVRFIPKMPREMLLRSYIDYDFFVFASAEAGGLAWVESLSTGLPVIGFTGPTELAATAGELPGIYLVEDKKDYYLNAKELADTILLVCNKSQDRVKISYEVELRYGWEIISSEIMEVYDRINHV
jgi:glycosyltransferase involved in cell wall biosynthesis